MKTCNCGKVKAWADQQFSIIVDDFGHYFNEKKCEIIQPPILDPNAKQKEAFKRGEKIEFICRCGYPQCQLDNGWQDAVTPCWNDFQEYRIKAQPHWSDRFKEAVKAGKIVEMNEVGSGWITFDKFKYPKEGQTSWNYTGNESDYRIVELDKVDERIRLISEIQNYLGNGGFFNPESMEHNKVRDLILNVVNFLNKDQQKLSPSEIQSLITALNESKRVDKVEDVVKKWSGNL